MQKFTQLTSTVIPLPLKDIDTDMIIPAQYLTKTTAEGYGPYLFSRLREQDPAFPLNLDMYKTAKFLVTEANFGCGSSREHAVWALLDYGIRAVIAPSFADIFAANSGNNGLVLVQLPQAAIDQIVAAAAAQPLELNIDLTNQTVSLADGTKYEFPFDPFQKDCIINGYDNLDYLLAHKAEIEQYRSEKERVYLGE